MDKTVLSLHTAFRVGEVSERLFGGFLEHLGRAVYGGVFDPGSKHADEDGFRTDVMDALRRLRMTAMRYPGGNFVSGYHWQDGVGPVGERPTVYDMAWHTTEPNTFGTDEFMRLCVKMGWEPMMCVNLGTGTPEEARDWLEYCNGPAGTRYADMRVANGHPEPYGVKLWCLGNEMDGPWQIGHVPAEQYALRAQQAAKMMEDTDPSIELIACGSCGTGLPSYMEWDRQVLEGLGDLADYVSIHRYVSNPEGDTAAFLAVTGCIDRQIEGADAVCRYVQARRHSAKRAWVCFDEWNCWCKKREPADPSQPGANLLKQTYDLEDALVVAGFLHSFVRHADVLKIANLAQIVNVIPPILTWGDDLLIQSIFHPFEMFSKRRSGIALRTQIDGPTYEFGKGERATTIDASAILGDGRLHVFLTNRDLAQEAEVEVRLADAVLADQENGEILTGPEPLAYNTLEERDVVSAHEFTEATVSGGRANVKLPPLSFAALTFRLE